MFARMHARGQKIELELKMEAHFEKELGLSHNIIGEITGNKYPNEIILMGGHVDSWDTGPQTGAVDDAAGFFVCYEAVRLLIELGIRPKRTIRFIAWTGEEFGEKAGAIQYAKDYEREMKNHIIAFESDMGTTQLEGFGFSGNAGAFKQIEKLIKDYLSQYKLRNGNGDENDTENLLENYKIPVMNPIVKGTADAEYYFTYHHSPGDTVSVLNKDELDSNVLGIASLFYLIADIDDRLSKDTN